VKIQTGRHINNVGTSGSADREFITYKYLNWLVWLTYTAMARFSLSALTFHVTVIIPAIHAFIILLNIHWSARGSNLTALSSHETCIFFVFPQSPQLEHFTTFKSYTVYSSL